MLRDLTGTFEISKASSEGDERTFEGYASVFDVVDSYGDVVVRGAFTKTIAERVPTKQVKVCRNHDAQIGYVVEAREDNYGLWVKGYISKTQAGNDTLEQMRDGSLNRMSWRGFALRGAFAEGETYGLAKGSQVYLLQEIALREVGPVDLEPANPHAHILRVKSLSRDNIDAMRELAVLVPSLAAISDPTPLERQVIKSALRLREVLTGDVGERLIALMAPDKATPAEAPATSTPEGNLAKTDLDALLAMIQRRGQS
jgi:HK97 family phage prohead protease